MATSRTKYSDILERIQLVDKANFKAMEQHGDFEGLSENPKEFLEEVFKRMSLCTRCALSEKRTQVVLPDGTYQGKIMILSEGPGSLEDASGLPFTGPMELKASRCATCANSVSCYDHRILYKPNSYNKKSKPIICNPKPVNKNTLPKQFYIRSAGAILDAVISKSFGNKYPRQNWINLYNKEKEEKIPYDSIWYITNTVSCRAYNHITGKDETPSNTFRSICKKWLLLQWAVLQPAVIVCLGKSALELLVGGADKANQVVAGELFDTKYGKVIYQPHPASVMRESHLESRAYGYAKLAETLKKAVEYTESNYLELQNVGKQ